MVIDFRKLNKASKKDHYFRGYTPRYDPAGLGDSPETWLELGDSLVIRPNMAIHR